MMQNKITDYRRIQNWENFFLDSALYSVVNSIGIEYDNSFTLIAAITGDLFTYMYSDRLPCDSGLTNYVIMRAPGKMQEHAYRVQLAAVLRQMSSCCGDILNLFASSGDHHELR